MIRRGGVTKLRVAAVTYGHTRAPEHEQVPRNSVHATNYHSLRGLAAVVNAVEGATLRDYSPPLNPGVDWEALSRVPAQIEPCDVLFAQGGVSLPVIQRARELNPACRVVLQRDSTHAEVHLDLMHKSMESRGIAWRHYYDEPHNLRRDLEEYELADRVFVLSRWVERTFRAHGLGPKTVRFAGQLVEVERYRRDKPKARFPFTVLHVGQLGLRKGTLDLLDAWRIFQPAHPNSLLYVAGLPESGGTRQLAEALDRSFGSLDQVERLNWVDPKHMPDLYARAHVLCAPSWEDGGTMVGPEAAMAGCAIVATENAGIDILDSGPGTDPDTGMMVGAGQPADIARALSELFGDRERCASMGKHARAAALATSSADHYADGFARAFGRAVFEWFPGLGRRA